MTVSILIYAIIYKYTSNKNIDFG